MIIVSFESHSSDTTVIDITKDRAAHALMFKEQLTPTQNRMKLQADRQRVYPVFLVGEQVLLKIQPYAQTSVVNRPYIPKVGLQNFGPHTILGLWPY